MTDLPPADFAVKPTLTGELAVLRPFVLAEDLPVIRSFLQDPEVGRLTDDGPAAGPWDQAAEDRMLAWYSTRHEQPDRLDLAIVDRAAGTCVGEAVLNQGDAAHRSCNFRIVVAAAGRNRGLGTEATRLIVGYGFDRLGLHRISLDVFSFNPRARRAYEKAGFVVEGVLRDALLADGGYADDVLMSILAPEWARHRGRPDLPADGS